MAKEIVRNLNRLDHLLQEDAPRFLLYGDRKDYEDLLLEPLGRVRTALKTGNLIHLYSL